MNKTLLSVWVGLAVVCLGLGYFLLYPGVVRIFDTISQTKQANEDLVAFQQKRKVISELASNNNLSTLKNTAMNYIPEDSKSGELILELNGIASQAGVNIQQVSLSSAAAAAAQVAGASEVGFQLKIDGSFENILKFFRLTETSSRLITLQTVDFSGTADTISSQISGKGYWGKVNTGGANDLNNIIVSQQTISKLQNLTTYSTPINLPSEAGFGRVDPFQPIR